MKDLFHGQALPNDTERCWNPTDRDIR